MKEVTPFTGLVIDYDSKNPESRLSYPFLNTMRFDNGSELITVSALHFSGVADTKNSENWQFPIYYDTVRFFAEQQTNLPTTGLNEGAKRIISPKDTLEAALAKESDAGLFTKVLQDHGTPVYSWDLTAGDEVRQLLWQYRGSGPLTDALKDGWPDEQEFKRAIGHFEVGKYAAQFARQRAEEYMIHGFREYALSRLAAQGALAVFDENDIDVSASGLEAMHREVCADVGVDLPFDPGTVAPDAYSSDEYAQLHFPPMDAPTEGYFADHKRSQRIGGLVSRIVRNEHLAEGLIDALGLIDPRAEPKRLIVCAGGRHVMDTFSIMQEELEYGLPLGMMEMDIGELACRRRIGFDYGFGSSHLEGQPLMYPVETPNSYSIQ